MKSIRKRNTLRSWMIATAIVALGLGYSKWLIGPLYWYVPVLAFLLPYVIVFGSLGLACSWLLGVSQRRRATRTRPRAPEAIRP